jgi:uncharacterized protein
VRFEWNADKDRANLAKHRVDFATAALVFSDPHLVLREDRTDEGGERRWRALGFPAGAEPLLLVVHVSGVERWRRNHPHRLGQKSW